jgi:hypothetical protein
LLFKSYTFLPSDDDLRYAYHKQKIEEKQVLPTADLLKRGYSQEQLDYMKEQLLKAGWGEDSV